MQGMAWRGLLQGSERVGIYPCPASVPLGSLPLRSSQFGIPQTSCLMVPCLNGHGGGTDRGCSSSSFAELGQETFTAVLGLQCAHLTTEAS